MMELYTRARNKQLYDACAEFDGDVVIVKKGSKINVINREKYRPSARIKNLRADKSLVDENGYLLQDIKFETLSASATFVTGRSANGMIAWKTSDNKCVKTIFKKN